MKTIWHWHLPLKTASEANCSEHWRRKGKRHRLQKEKVKAVLLSERPQLTIPCKATITRISPRQLDEHDNLRMSLKWVADAIAEYLVPGKAVGRADDCKLIKWDYKQKKGKVREYAIRIEIMMENS